MSERIITGSESAHWYRATRTSGAFGGDVIRAECVLEVTGANGKQRAPTLKDARKEAFFQSVTSIQNVLAKPGLDYWKQEQLLLACLTLPRNGDDDDAFVARILADSKAWVKETAEIGKRYHADMAEGLMEWQYKAEEPTSNVMLTAVRAKLKEMNATDLSCEHSFVNIDLGFAGCADLFCARKGGGVILADLKTRDLKEGKNKPYPSDGEQLAGYCLGINELGLFDESNISDTIWLSILTDRNTGRTEFYEWGDEEKLNALAVFEWTLNIWQTQRNFHAGIEWSKRQARVT